MNDIYSSLPLDGSPKLHMFLLLFTSVSGLCVFFFSELDLRQCGTFTASHDTCIDSLKQTESACLCSESGLQSEVTTVRLLRQVQLNTCFLSCNVKYTFECARQPLCCLAKFAHDVTVNGMLT